jgi:O-antigen/teichoic acid export membrane protein
MKINLKNKLIKNSSYYLLFTTIEVIIPLIILPFITKILSTEDYGIYVLFSTIVPLSVSFFSLGINDSLVIQLYKLNNSRLASYFTSNLIFIFCITLLLGFIIYNFRSFLFSYIHFPEYLFLPLAVVSFFQIFYSFSLHYFRFLESPKMFGLFSIFFSVIKNGSSVIFLYIFNFKLNGLIFSSLISGFIFFVLSIMIFYKYSLFSNKVNIKYAFNCLKLGFPLFFHQLGSWLSSSSIKLLISSLLGVSATGSFSIGLTVSLLILFLQDSFNKAFMPYLFEKLNGNNFIELYQNKIIKLTYLYNICLLLISIIYGFLAYFLIQYIFGIKYILARDVVVLLSISYAFEGMYKMHVNYLFYKNRTDLIFLITLITGFLNIILSYFFITNFGLFGAGLSLIISNLFTYIFCWYISNKIFPMNWLKLSVWS